MILPLQVQLPSVDRTAEPHGTHVALQGPVFQGIGAELPKGEGGYIIRSEGGAAPWRLKFRAPSFVNLQVLKDIIPGHMIADIVAILGSIDFVMGECDK